MKDWRELVLSLPGLPNGVTKIKTTVSTDFFKQFEQSPIAIASYDVKVLFDKKPGMYIMDVYATGWHEATCDRCLVEIQMPSEVRSRYFFNQKNTGLEEDEDVFTLEEGTVDLDLRPFVYESIILSLPLINVYGCDEDDPPPCDKNILEILRKKSIDESNSTDSAWDALKDINFED